jgi:hypothetical protein
MSYTTEQYESLEEAYERATQKINDLELKYANVTEKWLHTKCELDITKRFFDKLLKWAVTHDHNHELQDYLTNTFDENINSN